MSSRSDSPSPPLPAAGPAPIVPRPYRCVGCGYELTGLRLDARCPECGGLVSISCPVPATSGHAIAAMIFGAMSIGGMLTYGVPGIVFGSVAILVARRARREALAGRAGGSTLRLAKVGRVCGLVGIASGIVTTVVVVTILFVNGPFR